MLSPEQISRLAAVAAHRYARRCWWSDVRDLQQCAELAALEALERFDPQVGTAPEQYVWKAILLSVSRQLWHDSTPATAGTKHRPRKTAKGLTRSSVETMGAERSLAAPGDRRHEQALGLEEAAQRADYGWASPRPDALYEEASWLARVRARLEMVAGEVRGPGGRNALRVLLGAATAPEVALARGAPVSRVHHQSSALRGAIGADEVLYELIRERRCAE